MFARFHTCVIDLMFTFYDRDVDAVQNRSRQIKADEYCALDTYLSYYDYS